MKYHIFNAWKYNTELFQKIFKMFLIEAVKIGIYINVDYSKQPVEYCGMNLTSSIINTNSLNIDGSPIIT